MTLENRKAQREMAQQCHAQSVQTDLANAVRDTPIRARFHKLLIEEGFREHETPDPGSVYPSSHVQTLWRFFLLATLMERE